MRKRDIETVADLVEYLEERKIVFNFVASYSYDEDGDMVQEVIVDIDGCETCTISAEPVDEPLEDLNGLIEISLDEIIAVLPDDPVAVLREVTPAQPVIVLREITPVVAAQFVTREVAPGVREVVGTVTTPTTLPAGIREVTPRTREVAPGIRETTPVATTQVAPGIREITTAPAATIIAPGIREVTTAPIAPAAVRIRPCCANTRQHDQFAARCNQCGRLLR